MEPNLEKLQLLRIEGFFWIQFGQHHISFFGEEEPNDVHFSISFNPKATDANFHVTRNGPDPKSKPKIRIAIVDRCLIEKIQIPLVLLVLNSVTQEVNLDDFRTKNDGEIGYIPQTSLEDTDFSKMAFQKLAENCKEYFKAKKKNRLRILKEVDTGLQSFAESGEINPELLEHIVEVPTGIAEVPECGILIGEKLCLMLMKIGVTWYTLQDSFTMQLIGESLFGPVLTKKFLWDIKRAIVKVKNAQTYEDTKKFDNPFRLGVKESADYILSIQQV